MNLEQLQMKLLSKKVSKEHGKNCEKLKMVFDYENDLSYFIYKFENENEAMKAEPETLSEGEESLQVSNAMLYGIKDQMKIFEVSEILELSITFDLVNLKTEQVKVKFRNLSNQVKTEKF